MKLSLEHAISWMDELSEMIYDAERDAERPWLKVEAESYAQVRDYLIELQEARRAKEKSEAIE